MIRRGQFVRRYWRELMALLIPLVIMGGLVIPHAMWGDGVIAYMSNAVGDGKLLVLSVGYLALSVAILRLHLGHVRMDGRTRFMTGFISYIRSGILMLIFAWAAAYLHGILSKTVMDAFLLYLIGLLITNMILSDIGWLDGQRG